VSSTPSSVQSYTYVLWASEVIQIPAFGGSKYETKTVNLGDPSKIQIVNATYNGSVDVPGAGLAYLEYHFYVDGVDLWDETWVMIGGKREKTIDLTDKLSGGGLHVFKIEVSSTGSAPFVVDGYLTVQYVVLASGATIPTEVTTVVSPTTGGLTDIIKFVENVMPLVMLIVIAILFRSIVDSLKFGKEKSEK